MPENTSAYLQPDTRRRRRWDDTTPRDAAETKRLRPEDAPPPQDIVKESPNNVSQPPPAEDRDRYDADRRSREDRDDRDRRWKEDRRRPDDRGVDERRIDDRRQEDRPESREEGRGDERRPETRPDDNRQEDRKLDERKADDYDSRRRGDYEDGRRRRDDDRRWREHDDRYRRDDHDDRRRRDDYNDKRFRDDRDERDDRRRDYRDERRREEPREDRRRRDDFEDRRRRDEEERRRRDEPAEPEPRRTHDAGEERWRAREEPRRRDEEHGRYSEAGRRREDMERRRLHDSDDDEPRGRNVGDEGKRHEIEVSRKQYEATRGPQKDCAFCFGGPLFNETRARHVLMVMQGAYLAAQTSRDALMPYHALISTSDHASSSVELEDDVLEDIRDLKKYYRLFLKALPSKRPLSDCGYQSDGPFKPLFIEWYLPRGGQQEDWMVAAKRSLAKAGNNEPHFSIDCLALGAREFEEAKMAFAYEFENCGDTVNRVNKPYTKHPSNVPVKKLVRPTNPPPYVYVDFGLGEAYLHTMEANENFGRKAIRKILSALYGPDGGVDEETFDYDKFVSYFRRKFDEAFPL